MFYHALAAMLAIAACAGYAHADSPQTYTNPVYKGSMPDPGILYHEGRYYAFGTTGNSRLADGRVFRVLSSANLVDWKEEGGALHALDSEGSKEYWAPEVVAHEGVFYLYYSTGTLKDLHFEIRVATSNQPQGPYNDIGVALEEGADAQFFIDGHPFQDDDGQWYLFYAKDFLDKNDGYQAGTGIVVDRLVDMVRLEGKPQMVVRPRYAWTLFQANRKMEMYDGKTFDWHTIEAPWVVKRDGRYWCFYSGSNFGTANYGVDYVVADSVTGPYREQGQYARVIRGVDGLVRGPGHHSIVQSPRNATDLMVYHAWNADMSHRQMCIDPLVWTVHGPRCTGPSVDQHILPRLEPDGAD